MYLTINKDKILYITTAENKISKYKDWFNEAIEVFYKKHNIIKNPAYFIEFTKEQEKEIKWIKEKFSIECIEIEKTYYLEWWEKLYSNDYTEIILKL